jgi:hypothetical protein
VKVPSLDSLGVASPKFINRVHVNLGDFEMEGFFSDSLFVLCYILRELKYPSEGDANPAHLPRLGSLFRTWIRAGHLGSCAG